MPTIYAHCRFGEEMLRLMPADVRGTAKRHRQLFDLGLYGPDPLFYYRPFLAGKVRRLGQKFHMQTGGEFFSRVCRILQREPNESAQAYLYGVLCHFALDANCHALVAQAEGTVSPAQIETAFDCFLMERDGFSPSGQPCLTTDMALSDREWGIVSRFYPGTDKRIFRESVRSMAKVRRILEMTEGPPRTVLMMALGMGSAGFRDIIAGQTPDPECVRWNQPLLERYRQAAEVFPEMLLKLIAHLLYNAPLGEKFDPIFG